MSTEVRVASVKTQPVSHPMSLGRRWTPEREREEEEEVRVDEDEVRNSEEQKVERERARVSLMAKTFQTRLAYAKLKVERGWQDQSIDHLESHPALDSRALFINPPSHSTSPFASFGSSSLFSQRYDSQEPPHFYQPPHHIPITRPQRKKQKTVHRKPSPFNHHPQATESSSRKIERASTSVTHPSMMPPPQFLPRRHSIDAIPSKPAEQEEEDPALAINLLALAASSQPPSKPDPPIPPRETISLPASSVRGTVPSASPPTTPFVSSYDAFWSLHSLAHAANSYRS